MPGKFHGDGTSTGRIINDPPSDEYRKGWDRIFGKKDKDARPDQKRED